MTANNGQPGILRGCDVLPPIDAAPSKQKATGSQEKRSRKSGKQKTAERFVVLNRFVDFSLAVATRSEIAVWLILY